MRFVGIDVAAESHVFAILDEDGAVLARPTPFAEDAKGHARLLQALAGGPVLVVMEATASRAMTTTRGPDRPASTRTGTPHGAESTSPLGLAQRVR